MINLNKILPRESYCNFSLRYCKIVKLKSCDTDNHLAYNKYIIEYNDIYSGDIFFLISYNTDDAYDDYTIDNNYYIITDGKSCCNVKLGWFSDCYLNNKYCEIPTIDIVNEWLMNGLLMENNNG